MRQDAGRQPICLPRGVARPAGAARAAVPALLLLHRRHSGDGVSTLRAGDSPAIPVCCVRASMRPGARARVPARLREGAPLLPPLRAAPVPPRWLLFQGEGRAPRAAALRGPGSGRIWHGCGADGVPCCVQDDIKNRRKFLRRCEYPGEDGVLHVSRAAATRRQSERVVTLVRCKGADAQSRTERAGRECIALCWARCCSPGDAAGEADLRGALLQESRSRTCTWEQQSACTRASL